MGYVKLTRVPEGNVYGIQYNGSNLSDVLSFYFSGKDKVGIHIDTKTIQHGDTYIMLGDWVINDAGMKRIVSQGTFNTLYQESSDNPVPAGYKRVDSATGKVIQ